MDNNECCFNPGNKWIRRAFCGIVGSFIDVVDVEVMISPFGIEMSMALEGDVGLCARGDMSDDLKKWPVLPESAIAVQKVCFKGGPSDLEDKLVACFTIALLFTLLILLSSPPYHEDGCAGRCGRTNICFSPFRRWII